MPNHVSHDMWITGPYKTVDHIIATHIHPEGALDADSLIPYPKLFKDMDEASAKWAKENCTDPWGLMPKPGADLSTRPITDGFNAGGYDWCCSNWGTKWGCYDGHGIRILPLKDHRLKKIKLVFNTAWSPAFPVYDRLAEMYPDCRIKVSYFERGSCYSGTITYKNGHRISEKENRNYRGRRGG